MLVGRLCFWVHLLFHWRYSRFRVLNLMKPICLPFRAQHFASCPQMVVKTWDFRVLKMLNIHRAAVAFMKRFLISFLAATFFFFFFVFEHFLQYLVIILKSWLYYFTKYFRGCVMKKFFMLLFKNTAVPSITSSKSFGNMLPVTKIKTKYYAVFNWELCYLSIITKLNYGHCTNFQLNLSQ